MDPVFAFTAPASEIVPGDIIFFNGLFTVERVEDKTDTILLFTEGDDAPLTVEPDDRIDVYIYPAVSID